MADASQNASLICPICRRTLAPTERHGVTVYVCPVNHGAWADEDVFNHALRTVRSYQSLTELRIASRRSPRHPDVWMENFRFRGFYIDYCPVSHGVWLDWGEIRPVLEHDAKFKAHLKTSMHARGAGNDDDAFLGLAIADVVLESLFWILAAIIS